MDEAGTCLSCGIKLVNHDGLSRTCARLLKARRALREIDSLLALTTPSHEARELAKKALLETQP